jgi:hypothetical protein
MTTRYVLIDYENVQPKDLASLDGHSLRVIVFLGASQKTVRTELAVPLQALGENGRYERLNANGRNALDSRIIFHLGELATKDPSASFHVISKDGDYDPLLDHLRSKGIDARRSATLAPLRRVPDDRVEQAIDYLQNPRANKPKRATKLGNALKTHLGGKLEPSEVEQLIAELVRRGHISVTGSEVAYT